MPEKRNFTRRSGFRDSKLIIIAAEGENTERIYFSGIKDFYENARVHVEVLPRISSSDPLRVMEELNLFKTEYKLRKNLDQLWLVIDVDRWGDKKLSKVSRLCAQKGYSLAVSNPAFEIWLLFHIQSLDCYTDKEKTELLQNKKTGNRTRL